MDNGFNAIFQMIFEEKKIFKHRNEFFQRIKNQLVMKTSHKKCHSEIFLRVPKEKRQTNNDLHN